MMLISPRLEEILRILQSKQIETQSNEGGQSTPLTDPANTQDLNRFASLSLKEDIGQQETEVEDEVLVTTLKEQHSMETEIVDFDNGFSLEDDDLGEWIELSFLLYVSGSPATKLMVCKLILFEVSRRNSRPVQQVLDRGGEGNFVHLRSCVAFALGLLRGRPAVRGIRFRRVTSEMDEASVKANQDPGHRYAGIAFRDMAIRGSHRVVLPREAAPNQPDSGDMPEAPSRENIPVKTLRSIIASISQDDKGSAFMDYLAMDCMVGNMRRPPVSKRAIAAIESPSNPQPICEPLLPFINTVLPATELSIPIQAIFGMEMLLFSYKAYRWPDGISNEKRPRLLAIQLALEVKKSLSKTIKRIQGRASLSEINLSHLQKFLDGLES